jgi:hypothetical protein
MRSWLIALVVALGLVGPGDLGVPPAQALNIPLVVHEALPGGVNGRDRVAAPVTVGVPLPEGSGITSPGQLGLVGVSAGQFRVLGRWADGGMRWVLVDFQVDVPAGVVVTGVALTTGAGNFGGPPLASEDGTRILIDTGRAQFAVRKASFNLLDAVTVDGATLVQAPGGGALVLRDALDREFSSVNDSGSRAIVEDNGPVRAVVRADGAFRDGTGARLADYTVRLHFYRGKAFVKAVITLRNASRTAPTYVLFNSLEARLPVVLGASLTAEFARSGDTVVASLRPGEIAYQYQGFSTDKLDPESRSCAAWDPPVAGTCVSAPGGRVYHYDPAASGELIVAGGAVLHPLGNAADAAGGWADLRDGSGRGVTVAYRYLSAYWPAGFEVAADRRATVELFSRRNTKRGLRLAFGKHETREILWDFHRDAGDGAGALYALQYPAIARAALAHYRETRAIYGQRELVTPDDERAWFIAQGRGAPSLANPALDAIKRAHWWPSASEQIDFPLDDLQDYLRTGHGGFYLRGEARTIFNNDTAVPRSDDFTIETFAVTATAPAQSVNGGFVDMEHAHLLSLPVYYFLSGDERIREGTIDYGEYLDRTQIKKITPLPTTPYFRALSRKYRNFALLYEFTCVIATCNDRYRGYVAVTTDALLDSRDEPSLGLSSPKGRDLARGYMYWDSKIARKLGYRPVHALFHPQMHFEAVWQARRVMEDTGWAYPRKEEMEDYLLGLARFYLDEMYTEFGGGDEVLEFGYRYDYPLDSDPRQLQQARPYNSSRAGLVAYQWTGDPLYLARASKLLWGIMARDSARHASELQSQALMHAAVAPLPVWQRVTDLEATPLGDGVYLLRWTVPTGAVRYRLKVADRPIVDWLGFDPVARTFRHDPAEFRALFAATNVAGVPAPGAPGTRQECLVGGLDARRAWYFDLRAVGLPGSP